METDILRNCFNEIQKDDHVIILENQHIEL